MTRAFLGLGSNLGDRMGYLQAAVAAMSDCVAVSGVYETDPVGGPDQGRFLNVVAELDTDQSARSLLERCQRLEASADRVREVRWGPRTLDVDVLWVDGEAVDEPDLVVPHPRMFERAFVMVPLTELAPDLAEGWVDPGTGGCRRLGDWDELVPRTSEGTL
ncbi:MAG: 2-amino-4-hydroxy-6-hydroxymethyldihydropteridine diphosphokinase [Acidimicrobiia bacterium]|nr:2-amino-4-hydroxy-6-hydroxymethyldihydropteridine diphosphokinase [Acidimicrobiia bacterium]MYB11601.1 2-amino-4-hydroxy-6-hydroxymethyldihydropteridine diphosphokinase [Acidimicrobiia bacterium]MYG58661.1 2-amino-4-hydroxy-6-hydroxymethyldihydropteridine diphosphokinase [Acidimicrobiia bacterium]MYG73495.1 2-amino-4-hydroxy-6-hydroxymethyldihydropteridine diphosphokinase [Acidimicrobiia bacterium]MYJ32848.1 2-amino-4-hydroxy-6-hydroxymethyldihydropteridine diphosphokinase [Acidimicrobiia ba